MKTRAWSVANGIMLLTFLFAASVQWNDPDPVAWVALYVAAAVMCWLEMRRKTPRWAAAILAVIAFAWSGYLAIRARDVPISALFAEWEMRNLHVEEAREMYGLAIVGAWMLAIELARARGNRLPPSNG